jgi:hypothetical protein
MNFSFLEHQWKYFIRSNSKNSSVIIQVISVVIILYLLSIVCFIGLSLKQFLQHIYGQENIIPAFCGVILCYFSIDVIIRFVWQELPAMAVQPYVLLNIRRQQLVSFLNFRSLFSFLNLIPLFLFIPFISNTIDQTNSSGSVAMVCCIVSLCVGNNFLVLYAKRRAINSTPWLFSFVFILIVVAGLNYLGIIPLYRLSILIFTNILHKPWLAAIMVLYPITSFLINNNTLLNNFYFEPASKNASKTAASTNYISEQLISKGSLIELDLKSFFRNKRLRYILFMTFAFLFYGLIFFKNGAARPGKIGTLLLGSIMMIGVFAITFGQFFFSIQSACFDGLMSSNVNLKQYIKSKFKLITIITSLIFLISLLYGLIDFHFVFILCSAYFFSIGIVPNVSAFGATFNYQRTDVTKYSSFNPQETSSAQLIYTFIIVLIAVILFLPFSFFNEEWLGVGFLGFIGLVAFLLQDWWITLICKQLMKNKYKMMEGFRKV